MEENPEVYAKYQKLALEYSKLKAQVNVLKSAISEEKSTVAELQETVKKKDQLMRKLEQEVDCLNFRNLQLSKRVSVLQNDLEGVDNNKSKSKNSANQLMLKSESYDVMNLELQSRIQENERLHQQVYADDIEHQKKVFELSTTIEQLQFKLEEQEHTLNEKIENQEATINTLQKEKIKLQICIKNHEQEFKSHKSSEETKSRDINFVNEDLNMQLEKAKRVIAEKVYFNDKSEEFLNGLNVPVIQREKHEHLLSAMLKMDTYFSDFVRQLSDLHAFMIQRLCSNTSESRIKSIVVKLEASLREAIQHLKPLPFSFKSITSSIKDESFTWNKSTIMDLCNSLDIYERNLDKMLPYLILRIENKDTWVSSNPKLIELIPKLVELTKKLTSSFKKLYKYLLLLAFITSPDRNVFYATQPTVIKKILQSITSLQSLFEDARKLLSSKISLEHQLPMISQTEKSTDECILSTLVSLTLSLKKITDLIEKDMDLFSNDVWYKPRNSPMFGNIPLHPCVWHFKERGSKYLQLISEPEHQTIPYEVALRNHNTLREQVDNRENLSKQLEQYQNKVMQLEMDKENWMLECQLLRAKESKNPDSERDNIDMSSQNYDDIQQYVKNTVNQMIKQVQFADSKAIAFKNECEILYQRLQMCIDKKEALEKEISEAKQVITHMKDEQKTLTQSYDEQLNTMSEHLANLNEKLTAQKDEIDALKQAGNIKGSKNRKSK